MQEEKLARMKELDELLDRASRAYYQEAREIMSDHEYDALYEELTALEAETGIRESDAKGWLSSAIGASQGPA